MHLRTDVATWRAPALATLDDTLRRAGSQPIDLPWDQFELEPDGDHFTERGAIAFADALAAHVAPLLPRRSHMHILSDSTIDYNDRDDDGAWNGTATRRIVDAFASMGVHVRVDAISGSGFVARAREGEHFRARVPRGQSGHLLLVGGWNDVHAASLDRVCAAATACVNLAQR